MQYLIVIRTRASEALLRKALENSTAVEALETAVNEDIVVQQVVALEADRRDTPTMSAVKEQYPEADSGKAENGWEVWAVTNRSPVKAEIIGEGKTEHDAWKAALKYVQGDTP